MALRDVFNDPEGITNSKLVIQNTALALAALLMLLYALVPMFGLPAERVALCAPAAEFLAYLGLGAAGVFQWETRAHTKAPRGGAGGPGGER